MVHASDQEGCVGDEYLTVDLKSRLIHENTILNEQKLLVGGDD